MRSRVIAVLAVASHGPRGVHERGDAVAERDRVAPRRHRRRPRRLLPPRRRQRPSS